MVGVGEVAAAFTSLKAMKSIVQGLNATATQAAINEIKIELQGLILEAQQGLFAAQTDQMEASQRIAELEKQIMELKDWETEKERYELKAVDRTTMAYVPKAGMENGEPNHWLCTNCFESRQKSLLQFQGSVGPNSIYACNRCSGKVTVSSRIRPADR